MHCGHKLLSKICISYKFILSTFRPRLDCFNPKEGIETCLRPHSRPQATLVAWGHSGHELLSKICIAYKFILSTLRPRLSCFKPDDGLETCLRLHSWPVHKAVCVLKQKSRCLSTRQRLFCFTNCDPTGKFEAYCFSTPCQYFVSFQSQNTRQGFRFPDEESPRLFLGSWEV